MNIELNISANSAQKIPVALVDSEDKKTFIYQEEDLPSQFFHSPHDRNNPISTGSIEREDIPQAPQNTHSAAEAQSLFGGSQSASASMSANMHQIVEGVERLVDSDTYENPSDDQYAFLSPVGEILTPTRVSPNPNSYPFGEQNSPPLGSHIAPPPGLGPPAATDLLRSSSAQSYNPRPAIPSIPSIWNLGRDNASPRTPPGLGPQAQVGQQTPMQSINAGAGMSSESLQAQEQYAHEMMLRQHIIAQSQFSNSMDVVGSMPTPWTPSAQSRPTGNGWDHGRTTFGAFELPGQVPSSSSMGNPSWANEAFLASSLASGTPYGSGIGGRKSMTQLGAIGQTPPCGQGG